MAEKATIFLIEDNKSVRDTVTNVLVEEGYEVVSAQNAAEVTFRLETAKPDIILLDLLLPDGNGLNLIASIRERTDVPVIVVSGKGDMVDKVVGLEMGADDYISKPLQMKEVAARIKAQLRRYKAMGGNAAAEKKSRKSKNMRIGFDSWVLDCGQMQVFDKQEKSCDLTVKEFKLMEALVTEPNIVLSREQLLNKIQTDNFDITDRAIDVQVLRIRRKMGIGADEVIKAIRGVGYMLNCKTKII